MSNKIKESNITDSAVTTSKIADNAITSDKIAPGAVVAADVGDGTITTAKIADANVTTAKIADANITSGKIAADAIDGTKIADDAINSEHITDGSVDNVHLAGSIANDKLTNSSITINGTSISLGASGNIVAGTDWQSVITGAGGSSTAVASEGYLIDTSSNTHTLNLPASPSLGDEVAIVDVGGSAGTNAITIGRNGSNIEGSAVDIVLSANYGALNLVYGDATSGWIRYNNESPDTFIEATGGTVSTSGNYKIHTFTSSGCFSVSSASNVSDNNTVSYLVVAGGGAGGSAGLGLNGQAGGGGAGGFREGKSTVDDYTASPLNAPAGITVTTSTYPITVGAGGASTGPDDPGNKGSNSVFSTITSAGGGGGTRGSRPTSSPTTYDGGSGGGASDGETAGVGNSPPVSPSQGNPGGAVFSPGTPDTTSGGGGGAGAAGSNGNPGGPAGPGGAGATTNISASPVTYAGGGGGGGNSGETGGGTGGSGGGGVGGDFPLGTGTAGTTNRGSGGGASASGPGTTSSGAGGSGIVIIRYKYQ